MSDCIARTRQVVGAMSGTTLPPVCTYAPRVVARFSCLILTLALLLIVVLLLLVRWLGFKSFSACARPDRMDTSDTSAHPAEQQLLTGA